MTLKISTKLKRKEINYAGIIFLLGLFLKQFYLRKSGSIQIADVVVAFAAVMTLTSGKVYFQMKDVSLIIFIICGVAINVIYYLLMGNNFLNAALFLSYNLVVVIAFRSLMHKKEFPVGLLSTMKANLLTQLLIWLIGVGWNYSRDRYQGTFNDPNQFGFFIICCFFVLYLCSIYCKKRVHPIWHIIAGALVVVSGSRGMLLTFAIFLFFILVYPIFSKKGTVIGIIYTILFMILSGLVVAFGSFLFQNIRGIAEISSLDFVLKRFESLTSNKSIGGIFYSFFHNRLLIRFFRAPYYFLFGCGEGYWSRFIVISGEDNEPHCTMLSLCYCYGIIPYVFFIKWIRDNIKKVPVKAVGVYVALILEAFTLANHRQPFFWLIFAMGSYLLKESQQVDSVESSDRRTANG